MRSNIVAYSDRSDIDAFSQQNKDGAFSCALMHCQEYADCVTKNESVSEVEEVAIRYSKFVGM